MHNRKLRQQIARQGNAIPAIALNRWRRDERSLGACVPRYAARLANLSIHSCLVLACVAAATPAFGADADDLDEVIVTAQKKSENVQDIPLSVSAISAETLAAFNATQLSDYAAAVPGLQVASAGAPGYMTISLRGVSTGALYESATTAIYVDDVPIGSSSSYAFGASVGLDLLPFDLDRVEVLKGPQGTLYGASSMGGLVKYVLSSPDTNKTSVRIGGDLSNVEHASEVTGGGRLHANISLLPGELAISVSGARSYAPGFITNVANGEKGINGGTQDGARLAALWQPGDRLSVKLSALLNRADYDNLAQIQLTPDGRPAYGELKAFYVQPNDLESQTTLYSADVRYELDWASLTSVTGWSKARVPYNWDFSTAPFFQSTLGVHAAFRQNPNVDKFTQELRLSSPERHRVQWSLGAFYTEEDAQISQTGRALDPFTGQPEPTLDPLVSVVKNSSFKEAAMFANATYELTSKLDIGFGGRYSHNDQTVETIGTGPGGVGGFLFGSVTQPYATAPHAVSEGVFTYSISSRYRFAPDAMIYARVASGYRPGGVNAGIAGAPPTFAADEITNYELGLKSEFFDRRLLLNADVFYIDWREVQLGAHTSTRLIYTGNAGTASSKGAELTAQYAAMPELRVGLNAVYNDAQLTSEAPAVGGAKGDQLPLSAQWSAAVTGEWVRPLSGSYTASVAAAWRYVDARYTDFPRGSSNGYLRLPSHDTVDLSAKLTNDRWSVGIFGKNVRNSTGYLRYYAPMATVLQPRTVGMSVDVAF